MLPSASIATSFPWSNPDATSVLTLPSPPPKVASRTPALVKRSRATLLELVENDEPAATTLRPSRAPPPIDPPPAPRLVVAYPSGAANVVSSAPVESKRATSATPLTLSKVAAPAPTIDPSPWTARSLNTEPTPMLVVVMPSPPPNVVSGAPAGSYRISSGDVNPSVVPPTTIFWSFCIATANAASSTFTSVITMPLPPPNYVSSEPSALSRTTATSVPPDEPPATTILPSPWIATA